MSSALQSQLFRTTNLNKAVLDQKVFYGCGWVTDESEDFLPAVSPGLVQ